MAWEPRNRSNCYYYGGKRQGNRIIKEYLGRGITAALIAAALLKQKEHRHALWKKRRELFQGLQVIHSHIRSFLRFSGQIQRLLRFIERDTREGILISLTQEFSMANQTEEPILLPMNQPIDEVLTRAKQRDPHVLPQVRQLIEQKPELWQRMMDLARQAQEAQIHALAGDDQILKAAVLSKFNALKKELGDGCSNPLEQIIIERILISWLQIQHTDLLFAKTPASDSALTKLLHKRADLCQGRLQRAITQLQAMRKPIPPTRKKEVRLYASMATE